MSAPPSFTRLVHELSRLPGIGERTATRLALFILRSEREYAESLAQAVWAVKTQITLCTRCFALAEGELCSICRDPRRADDVLCVVGGPADLMAIERSGGFRGRYHVLHGVLSPLNGVGPDQLKIAPLLERVERDGVKEVIVATNPTVEGEATALYLAKLCHPLGVRVSRIARGVPMGGDIEYVDTVTLSRAIEGRREI